MRGVVFVAVLALLWWAWDRWTLVRARLDRRAIRVASGAVSLDDCPPRFIRMVERAVGGPLDFDAVLPDTMALLPHQHVAIAYALLTRRCFLAEQQGVGKTIEALVAVEVECAYPAVVVCPSGLKGNWYAEVRRCLPHRSVEVLYGERPRLPRADVIVLNWDILVAWEPVLAPVTLILDESHYAMNGGTEANPVQRTQAAIRLAERAPEAGMRFDLSGTPAMNRLRELVTQLEILGRLRGVTPRPERGDALRDWERSFLRAWCDDDSDPTELNRRLRETCLVRRRRKDALGMEDTEWVDVALDLDGELDDYRHAEEDFLAYIEEQGGPEAALKASRALVIVQMNELRELAGLAKIEAAVEWVRWFFEQHPKESLVVFAVHRKVQAALIEAFPGCASIVAETKRQVDQEKARFLSGGHRLIVVSMQMGREGHTLCGPEIDCHQTLFVQPAWNPGIMDQGADRVNRIGQRAPQCYAHHLIVQGTIEVEMAQIIEGKRRIINAGVDGVAMEEERMEKDVQYEVLMRMAERNGSPTRVGD
jgi:SWI/SNF-related matrix-associated actin-dependent regulator 1 of chromatin subfamily A